MGNVSRKRNYATTYAQRQRLLIGSGKATAGPLDTRKDMILLAEYLSTPGKRAGEWVVELNAEQAQAAALLMATNRVVGPYRRELGQRKLNFFLPGLGLPGPRTMKIRIPETAEAFAPRSSPS